LPIMFSLSVSPVLPAQLPLLLFVCRHCFDLFFTTNNRKCILVRMLLCWWPQGQCSWLGICSAYEWDLKCIRNWWF